MPHGGARPAVRGPAGAGTRGVRDAPRPGATAYLPVGPEASAARFGCGAGKG